MKHIRQHPILILLIINLMAGIFTFNNYGLSWDEPLFYDYANALGYAYSPKEWISGNFNLDNAYGSSETDHANRGPAYIILAHPVVSIIEILGADNASAWHLVNFLTFQLGVYFLYCLAKRTISTSAALISAALFAWQPLLWGHAFINPKDPPFLVFFLGAIYFGLMMVDDTEERPGGVWKSIGLASFFLGVATSIRVLGPLAGVLVFFYALGKFKTSTLIKTLSIYAAFAFLVAFITWPYLWTDPLHNFIEAFGFMSDNPTQLHVLFNGQLLRADELPRRYLPILISLTLTEPVLPLFIIGILVSYSNKLIAVSKIKLSQFKDEFLLLLWFFIPFAYVVLRKPPMYDGYRHFLFMLPPLFILAGSAIEKAYKLTKSNWAFGILTVLILAPGIFSIFHLHPYEYTYYNSYIGGTSGAFRRYETDYWLTCYKEAIEQFDVPNAQLFIKREPYIAEYYANGTIMIRDYRAEFGNIHTDDFVLVNTRANEDIKTFKDASIVLQINRGNAVFCEIKKIP